jgi:hypothetical protein
MVRFNFRKEKIVVDATFYMFDEFVQLWEWDKSKDKAKANKLLYFIFLLCDLTETNSLKDIPAEKREVEALYRVFKSRTHSFTTKELSLLTPAIECYIENNEMPEERILMAFDEKADELRDLLERTKFETIENKSDGVSTFSSNSEIITKGLKELDIVKKLKASVVSAIKKDAMSQKVRGQQQLSPLSKGVIELPDFKQLFKS